MRPWAGAAAGVVLVAVAVGGLWHPDAVEAFGAPPAPAGRPAPVGATDDGDAGRRATPAVATRSADLAAHAPRPSRSAPASVRIEALDILAAVDSVGVAADGALEIPADIRRAGWFSPGPAPGERHGSSVIAAHVDGPDGPGAFHRLRDAQPGDRVVVVDGDGERVVYAVTALAHYGKGELPVTELFAAGGPHRLVLVTCGGGFDEVTRSYADNVVVIAEPVPAAER